MNEILSGVVPAVYVVEGVFTRPYALISTRRCGGSGQEEACPSSHSYEVVNTNAITTEAGNFL